MAAWEAVPTPGNGDCLFHALAAALRESDKATASHTALRQVVARTMLAPSRATEAALVAWMSMVEAGLGDEVPHAAPLAAAYHRQGRRFTRADLHTLYARMLDPRLYWGDEYAIRVLERAYGCCVLIYAPDGTRLGHHLTCHVPAFYVPLLYDGGHYTQLRYGGRSALDAIPPSVT
jgi:hypothetical protein